MILLIGIALLMATVTILCFTFISAARLDHKPLSLGILSSKRLWEIYVYGSYHVMGKPIRPLYGLILVFFTFILFPASYSIDLRFRKYRRATTRAASASSSAKQMNSFVKVARMGSSTTVKDDTTCYITGEALVVDSGSVKTA